MTEEKKVTETKEVETVAKEKFDELVTEYQKLANAFNRLLQEYNDLHVKTLFIETK